jgi:chromosome segregation ATPase
MVNVIKTIQEIRSVDAVTAGAAGGEFEEFAEADFQDENDIMLVDVAAIESRRPDLFDEIRARLAAEQTEEATKMADTVEQLQEALTAANGERDEYKTKLEETEAKRDELQAKLSEKEQAEARATVAAKVDELIAKAEPALSETAAARVRRTFADRSESEGLGEAVEAEIAEMHKIADEAKGKAPKPAIEGMGDDAPAEGDVMKADEAAKAEMVARFQRGMEKHGNKTPAEIEAAVDAYKRSL